MSFRIPDVKVAFFDLDDTLTRKDTNTLWLEWRMRRDPRGIPELLVAFHNGYYFRKGRLTDSMMNLYFQARTVGLNAESYRRMSERFFEDRGREHIYPQSLDLIKAHKRRNIRTVIITGQDDFLASPFFRFIEADDLISNKRIISGNKFAGFEKPNCYAEGKIILAGKYLEKINVKLEDCAFYSDSISDLPLLRKVRHPFAVNPDPALAKIADDMKWEIYNFQV